MKIHKEGYISIAFALAFGILLAVLTRVYVANAILTFIIYWFVLHLIAIVVYFFRVPNRELVQNENQVISPADGKIVVIEKVFENECLHREMMQVSIFMSPLNVHLNRLPVSGVIRYYKYHAGKFLLAFNPKSSLLNERTTTVVENELGIILIRQIAGGLARRIVSYMHKDKAVSQSEELGFIKFGSRVDLLLPLNANIKVKLGEKTKGGLTLIADYDSASKQD